jgi:SulP family sulfate permease
MPSALGVAKPDVENAVAAAASVVAQFAARPNWAVLGLLALSVLLAAALPRLHRSLPAGLLAVAVVTLVVEVSGARVARIGSLPSSLPLPALPDLGNAHDLVGAAAVVAFLAALESLLSARVADGMSDAPRHDPDRELFGQGLANVASGLCGGLPATGAIARTAVNARAGASTRVAALTHALVLAAIVYAASGLVGSIPLVALAGVLLVTAYRMVERHTARAVLRSTRGDALVFLLTALGTVAFDLVTAVEVGLGVAILLAVVRLARTASAVPETLTGDGLDSATEHALLAGQVLAYRLDGPLFFAVADRFLREITATSAVRVVILRLGSVVMLDATGAHVLGQIVEDLHRRGITVLVKVASAEHRRLLAAVGALAPLVERGHVFDTFPEAAAHAARHVAAHTHAAGVATHWPHGPQAALPDHQVIQVTPTADLSPTVPNERITSDRR